MITMRQYKSINNSSEAKTKLCQRPLLKYRPNRLKNLFGAIKIQFLNTAQWKKVLRYKNTSYLCNCSPKITIEKSSQTKIRFIKFVIARSARNKHNTIIFLGNSRCFCIVAEFIEEFGGKSRCPMDRGGSRELADLVWANGVDRFLVERRGAYIAIKIVSPSKQIYQFLFLMCVKFCNKLEFRVIKLRQSLS